MKILAFGICKEIFSTSELELFDADISDVASLKRILLAQYPALGQLRHFMIAVNNEYAIDTLLLHESDEIAIIPPVSGG
jgi:molybdopterin converting factor subunit 1